MMYSGTEWGNTAVQEGDDLLVVTDEAATSIEIVEVPRSEGPKGQAVVVQLQCTSISSSRDKASLVSMTLSQLDNYPHFTPLKKAGSPTYTTPMSMDDHGTGGSHR
jgi:hypothetical protein